MNRDKVGTATLFPGTFLALEPQKCWSVEMDVEAEGVLAS